MHKIGVNWTFVKHCRQQ